MPSDQIGGCLSHFVYIQLIVIEIRIQSLCRHWKLPVQDAVFVGFFTVTVAWMKIRLHFLRKLDTDVLRQTLVQCVGYFFSGNACVRIKNSYISQGMHTGICTARTHDLDFFSE